MAVEKIDLRQANDVWQKTREWNVEKMSNHEEMLRSVFALDSQTSLSLISHETDQLNWTHSRYEMLYNQIPVWGHSLVITENAGRPFLMYGEILTGIEQDLRNTSEASFDSAQALVIAKKHHEDQNKASWIYPHESSRLVIYVHENQAKLSYEVTFFADVVDGGQPSEPMYLISACTGEILLHYENLKTDTLKATGPGGNQKNWGIYLWSFLSWFRSYFLQWYVYHECFSEGQGCQSQSWV
jgi:Zn-dependent metalloprotease